MNFIKDPEGMDFAVVPKHLTDEEANEISDYIEKYKAAQKQALEIKVQPANSQELDFLLTLLQKLNVKWTLVGGDAPRKSAFKPKPVQPLSASTV